MGVLLDGVAQLEYDREKPLPDHQATYLDKMDEKMAEGITLGDEEIKNPDVNQRAQFVVANLVHALKTDNEQVAGAMCSYLALRLPDLKQIKITDHAGEVSVEFDYEREYTNQVAVKFTLH
ncbi:MAG: hypothetical protein GXP23_00955 [Gammaproteobacteria bacterium]|nr:hypothetical protein [Gammaproteobacteria bacterium]